MVGAGGVGVEIIADPCCAVTMRYEKAASKKLPNSTSTHTIKEPVLIFLSGFTFLSIRLFVSTLQDTYIVTWQITTTVETGQELLLT